MGGKGSGRPPSVKTLVNKNTFPVTTDLAYSGDEALILPNLSGDHSAGRVNITPSNPTDLVNKKYVDSISINTGIDLFAYDDASDTGSYKQFKLEPSTGAEVEGDAAVAGNSMNQLVGARITEVGIDVPVVINTLTAGIYNFHVHMKAASAGKLKFYAEFYVRHTDTSETLIATSIETEFIGTTNTGYNTHATVTTEYPLVTGDRIVVKGYVNNHSPSSNTIYIYVEGDTATRVSVRGLSIPKKHSALTGLDEDDHTQYVLADGTRIITGSQKIADLGNEEAILLDSHGIDGIEIDNTGAFIGWAADLFLNYFGTGDLYLCGGGGNVFSTHASSTMGTSSYPWDLVYCDEISDDGTNTTTPANLKTAYTHSQIAGGNSVHVSTTENTEWDTAYTHSQDNTQAHTDYLLNSEADTGVGLVLTGDNSSADTQYTAQVLYNTDDTPPAASGFPIGTIYIQYTA